MNEEQEGFAAEAEEPKATPEATAELPGVDVARLEQALAEEKAKAERYLANWQRAQADFLNLKRRAEQEKEDQARFSNAMLMVNLLPALDDLERALSSVPTKLAGLSWVQGIGLIYRKLLAALEANGLTEIKAEGETFDPKFHEAVLHSAGPADKVIQVVQKGYRLNDRVIRPAMVVVGSGEAEPSQGEAEAGK